MTEKEKMLKGEIYDANYNADLIAERAKAKGLCFAYNAIPPSNTDERQAVMKKFSAKQKETF